MLQTVEGNIPKLEEDLEGTREGNYAMEEKVGAHVTQKAPETAGVIHQVSGLCLHNCLVMVTRKGVFCSCYYNVHRRTTIENCQQPADTII